MCCLSDSFIFPACCHSFARPFGDRRRSESQLAGIKLRTNRMIQASEHLEGRTHSRCLLMRLSRCNTNPPLFLGLSERKTRIRKTRSLPLLFPATCLPSTNPSRRISYLPNKLSREIKATQAIVMPKPTGKPPHISPLACITLETSPLPPLLN